MLPGDQAGRPDPYVCMYELAMNLDSSANVVSGSAVAVATERALLR